LKWMWASTFWQILHTIIPEFLISRPYRYLKCHAFSFQRQHELYNSILIVGFVHKSHPIVVLTFPSLVSYYIQSGSASTPDLSVLPAYHNFLCHYCYITPNCRIDTPYGNNNDATMPRLPSKDAYSMQMSCLCLWRFKC
jgi:hypothetical protein